MNNKIYKRGENKNGEIILIVPSPFNAQNFAILNRTKNEFTVWDDITNYKDAMEKFEKLIKQ